MGSCFCERFKNFTVSSAKFRDRFVEIRPKGETGEPGGEVLPYKRLIGMCRRIGSHFHDWSDYNGVAFLIDLLEWGRKFSDFWGK